MTLLNSLSDCTVVGIEEKIKEIVDLLTRDSDFSCDLEKILVEISCGDSFKKVETIKDGVSFYKDPKMVAPPIEYRSNVGVIEKLRCRRIAGKWDCETVWCEVS